MDGTMVDSMPFHAKSWVEFAGRHGVPMDVQEILRRTTGRTGIECMREIFGRDLPHERAQVLVDEKEAIYRELFAPVFSEVAGFRDFVAQTLRHGLRYGVATAGDRHNIAFVLDRLKLPARPEVIVGGDEGLAGKPEPDLFLEAARRLQVPAAQCIVFEDAPFGIEAARRAGMRAVSVCTTHTAAELAGPHVVAQVRDYHQLTSKNFWESLDA
jgi:beta-phosphoglucomutase-like phosphatase (HAD superfamily)